MKMVVLDGAALNPGDVSWEPLAALGELAVYEDTKPELFQSRVRDADIVLVNKVPVRRMDIKDLASCKLVGVLATGANNLDLEDLARAGIAACNVPGYGAEDVAQHALALLMELARDTAGLTAWVKAGEWQKSGKWCYWRKTPLSLAGLTIGIVGFGAIGQILGRICHALGMKVLANSRHQNAKVDYPFEYASLEEIWANANVISLHCPLTEETSRLVNARSLEAMRDGAILINTARGGLVDEAACARALKSGKLAGMGTDVLAVEPPLENNPLLTASNVLITPHMAWATTRARQNIIDIMASNIKAFFAGTPQNIINHE